MADARIDIRPLLALAEAGNDPPTQLGSMIAALAQAVEHASWQGSDEITWLGEPGSYQVAIVPAIWAQAVAELRADPGGTVAQWLAGIYRHQHTPARPLRPAHQSWQVVATMELVNEDPAARRRALPASGDCR